LGRGARKKSNKHNFFLIVIFIIIWTTSNYIADTTSVISWILFCARSAYAAASIIVGLFLYFSLIFPEGRKSNFKSICAIFSLSLLSFIISYTPLVVKGVQFNLGKADLIAGPAYVLLTIYFIVYLGASFYILLKKFTVSAGVEKQQIKYFFMGAFLATVAPFFTNLVIPLATNNWGISHFGPYFTIFLVGLTTYAILKHHLFDIKIIATELFTVVISFILFTKIFSPNGNQDLLFNIGIFFSVLLFGMLLVRAVIREAKQREQIQKMAEDVKRAYETEKKANEELEKLDKYKNDFLTQAQHDLKNPLAIIMGYTDLLLGGKFGKIPEKGVDIIKRIQVVTQDKIKDVNNFLDTEQFKLGKGVVLLKPNVDLFPILEKIASGLAYQAESKGIYLRLAKPGKTFIISADEEKLKSSLFNIVDNAVKFTEKGGVDIKIQNNETVKIIISDTGIGIPQDKIKSIFETRFERTIQAEKTAVGSGVGLYLSAQIIKLHNGRVWAESEGEGGGSTFYIELPAKIDDEIVTQASKSDEKI